MLDFKACKLKRIIHNLTIVLPHFYTCGMYGKSRFFQKPVFSKRRTFQNHVFFKKTYFSKSRVFQKDDFFKKKKLTFLKIRVLTL